MRIAVTDAFRPLLTECLLAALQGAAADIQQSGLDPENFAEPLERFDSIRATLDALGWGALPSIDVTTHRDVLQAALLKRLATERECMVGGSALRTRRAGTYAGEIGQFLEEVR
jgi:hypothetical protein